MLSIYLLGTILCIISSCTHIEWILIFGLTLFLVGFCLVISLIFLSIFKKHSPEYADYKNILSKNPSYTKRTISPLVKKFDEIVRLNFVNLPHNNFELKKKLI